MLNHAAALRTVLFTAAFALVATGASALDGIELSEPIEVPDQIELSEPTEPAGEDECPRLVQIKYPFLSCVNGQIGQSDANETWENSRQLPQQGAWNEGDGAWGPDQNQN